MWGGKQKAKKDEEQSSVPLDFWEKDKHTGGDV